jgi:Zn-dependent protease with chaperone function
VIAVAISSATLANPLDANGAEPVSERVTVYDIATRDDLLFSHLVAPLLKGEVGGWPILGGVDKQVGDWIDQYMSATQIANLITDTFPMGGQPPARPIEKLVEQCAHSLGIAKPRIYVRNSPFTQAYVISAFGENHLVFTSGLLNLYAGRPEELKFVVGHELGHVKCGHIELKQKSYGLLAAIQAINVAVVPDRYQGVLPTLALGRLYSWCRESEISADRAGLLCCGEPKVAYQAIMRLQHGLNADSTWIDPESPDFDPAKVIKDFKQWQHEPFVKLLVDLKRHALTYPFVPERLAALKSWADTGAYHAILDRRGGTPNDQLIEVVRIQAFELAPEGQTIDPYILVFDRDQRVLRTVSGWGLREAQWQDFRSTDRSIKQPRSFHDGQPLFFEIWDDNTLYYDTLVGGFVVYPDSHDATRDEADGHLAQYTTRIQWDWKDAQAVSRNGFARVQVRFLRRQAAAEKTVAQKRETRP